MWRLLRICLTNTCGSETIEITLKSSIWGTWEIKYLRDFSFLTSLKNHIIVRALLHTSNLFVKTITALYSTNSVKHPAFFMLSNSSNFAQLVYYQNSQVRTIQSVKKGSSVPKLPRFSLFSASCFFNMIPTVYIVISVFVVSVILFALVAYYKRERAIEQEAARQRRLGNIR